jgi:hypothetical protein
MTTLTRSGLSLAVLLAAASVAPRVQASDPAGASARAHFDKGIAFAHLGRWPEALLEFENAYVDKQDPLFLFQVAECHRRLGNETEAVRKYHMYLEAGAEQKKRRSKSTHDTRAWDRWKKGKEPKRAEVEKTVKALEASAKGDRPPVAPPSAPTAEPAPAPVVAAAPPLPPAPPPAPPLPLAPPPASEAPLPPSEPSGASGLLVPDLAAAGDNADSKAGTAPSLIDLPPAVASSAGSADEDRLAARATPVYKRWWFWTAIGAAVAAGTVTVLVLAGSKDPSCPSGYQCRSGR